MIGLTLTLDPATAEESSKVVIQDNSTIASNGLESLIIGFVLFWIFVPLPTLTLTAGVILGLTWWRGSS